MTPRKLADVASVEDGVVPGPAGDVPIRTYRPATDGPHPTIVFFHGGGFVIGDLASGHFLTADVSPACGAAIDELCVDLKRLLR